MKLALLIAGAATALAGVTGFQLTLIEFRDGKEARTSVDFSRRMVSV